MREGISPARSTINPGAIPPGRPRRSPPLPCLSSRPVWFCSPRLCTCRLPSFRWPRSWRLSIIWAWTRLLSALILRRRWAVLDRGRIPVGLFQCRRISWDLGKGRATYGFAFNCVPEGDGAIGVASHYFCSFRGPGYSPNLLFPVECCV